MIGRFALSAEAGALLATTAAAVDLTDYEPRGEVADWQILCAIEEDMGQSQVLDCVLRSAGEPALVVSRLDGVPALSRSDGLAVGHLNMGRDVLDLAGCPDGQCPFEGGLAALASAFDAGASIDTDGARTTIATAGFADAAAEAVGLID